MNDIVYRTGTAAVNDIHTHLVACDDTFVPPLSTRVDLREFSQKMFDRAVTFEAWDGTTLVGLIGAYFNDMQSRAGFITHVSLLKEYGGIGIAAALMRNCMEYARRNAFREVGLEVAQDNLRAVRLYEKFGFRVVEQKNGSLFMKHTMAGTA